MGMIRYGNGICKRYGKILIGFLLCSFATLLFCIGSITQFDQASSIITGDSLELYVPGLRALARNIREGNSLSYSWNLFLGMNATAYYTAVVGGSLVNLIYILFPQLGQNLAFALSSSPQSAQTFLLLASFSPQLGQNLDFALTSSPHFGHLGI